MGELEAQIERLADDPGTVYLFSLPNIGMAEMNTVRDILSEQFEEAQAVVIRAEVSKESPPVTRLDEGDMDELVDAVAEVVLERLDAADEEAAADA